MTAAVVVLAAFASNLPLGAWRETVPRFSWKWFLAIHAAVPFIAGLRIFNELPLAVIPALVVAAIAGQVTGSRLLRRRRSATSM